MSVLPIFQATPRNADIQRARGHSSVASAAYISGRDVVEKRNGETVAHHRYARKEEVLFSDLYVPKNAPDYVPRDPLAYWQAREEFEDQYIRQRYRKTPEYAEERVQKAQIALKQIIPLPSEWTADMMRDFGQRYAEAFAEEFGLPVHIAGHDDRLISKPGRSNRKGRKAKEELDRAEREDTIKIARKKEETIGGLNNHVHVQIDHRPLGADGWGSKPDFIAVSTYARKNWTEDNRRFVAALINEISAENGLDIVAEARSLEKRGSPFSATVHEGQAATAMRRSGKKVSVADYNDEVRVQNREEVLRDPDAVIRHISLTRATFSEADLKRELFNRVMGDDTDYTLVEHKMMTSDLLVRIGEDVEGRTRYATKEHIGRERLMFDAAADLAKTTGHEARQDVLERDLQERFAYLSAEQTDAVRLLSSTSGFGVLKGSAGVGKSTLLKAAIPASTAAGQRIRPFAPTGQAAKILGNELAMQANTWASYTYRREKAEAAKAFLDKAEKEKRKLDGRTTAALKRDLAKFEDVRIKRNDFVLVDESGMLSVKDMSLLLDEVRRAGAKIRLVGDDAQFSSVEAGAALRGLVEEFGSANVLAIRRQKQQWAIDASMAFERGDVRAGLSAYRDRHLVRFESDRESTYHALVDSYMKDMEVNPGDSRQILAYTKKDVAALNQIARDRHVAAGLVDAQGVDIGGQLVGRGDKVVFLKNDLASFKVRGVDGYDQGVANGTMGTVEKVEGKGLDTTFTVVLHNDKGKQSNNRVTFRLEDYESIQAAYATTSHKSQGSTYTRAFSLASKYQRTDALYVSMTRAEQETTLFVDASELADFDNLVRSASRKPGSDLVRDYQPKPPPGTTDEDPGWDLARRISASRQDVVSVYAGMMNWKEFHQGDAVLKEHADYQVYREALKAREKDAKRALEYMNSYQDLRAIPDSKLTPAKRQERDLAGHVSRVLEQNGMRRDLIATWANDPDRPRTDAELLAIEKLEVYAGVNRSARDLYNLIKSEVGTKQLLTHKRWAERQSLVLERNALAAEIRADSPTYRRHLHEVKGVSWTAIGKQASEHDERVNTSDPAGKTLEEYKKAGRRVDELKRRPHDNLTYRAAVAKFDRLAVDLYEAVDSDTLRSFGVYESIIKDQSVRHSVREQFAKVLQARNIRDPSASVMRLEFGNEVLKEAEHLRLPGTSKLAPRPYDNVLAEHGIQAASFLAELGLKVGKVPDVKPAIRSSLTTPSVLTSASPKPKAEAQPVQGSAPVKTAEQVAQPSPAAKAEEGPVVEQKMETKADDRPVGVRMGQALKERNPWAALKTWIELLPLATDLTMTKLHRGVGFSQRKARKVLEGLLFRAYGDDGRRETDFAIRTWQAGEIRAWPEIEVQLSTHRLRGTKIIWADEERKDALQAVSLLQEAVKSAAEEASRSDIEDDLRRKKDEKIEKLSEALGAKYDGTEKALKAGDDVDNIVREAIKSDPLRSYRHLKGIEDQYKPQRVPLAHDPESWNFSLKVERLRVEAARSAIKTPAFNDLPAPEQAQIKKDARLISTEGGKGPSKGSGPTLK